MNYEASSLLDYFTMGLFCAVHIFWFSSKDMGALYQEYDKFWGNREYGISLWCAEIIVDFRMYNNIERISQCHMRNSLQTG